MKCLILWLAFLLPIFAQAQIRSAPTQKDIGSRILRTNAGTDGLDTIPSVRLTAIINGQSLIYNSTTGKFHATSLGISNIASLQDSLTIKANKSFNNVTGINLTSGIASDSLVVVRNGKLYSIAGSEISSVGFMNYIFSRDVSDIAGYEQMPAMSSYTTGIVDTATATVSTVETLLQEFATNSGFPNTTVIPVGVFNVHYDTQKAAGSINYYTYAKIYKRSSAGTETLLAITDNTTQTAVNTIVQSTVSSLIPTQINLLATDRIIVKIFAKTLSSTSSINLYYDGTTNANLEFPSVLVNATNFIPYAGATKDLVSVYSIQGDSIKTINGLSTEFLKADGSKTTLSATSPIFYNSGVISSQAASATLNGYMTTGSQAFAGSKTFNGNTYFGTGLTSVFEGSTGRLIIDKLRIYNVTPEIIYHDISSSATTNRTLSIPDASLTIAGWATTPINGALTKWNGTVGLLTNAVSGTDYLTPTGISATSPIFYNSTTGVISSQAASATLNGHLTSADWTTFNNKQPAGSYATLAGIETLTNKSISGGQITSAVANATLAANSTLWGGAAYGGPYLPTGGYTGSLSIVPSAFSVGNGSSVDANSLTLQAANSNALLRFKNAAGASIGSFYWDGINMVADYSGGWKFLAALTGTAATLSGGVTAAALTATQNSNSVVNLLTSQNTSTGASARNRARFGNDASTVAFTVDVYGSGVVGNSNYVRLTNQLNAPLILGANGGDNLTIAGTGAVTLSSLAGTGTRMVVADNLGGVSTQAIPGGGGGSVTGVAVASANGLAGTSDGNAVVPTLTLTTSVNSPVLAGNGTAISAATTTGSGSTVVLATSPTLTTPTLGVAAATTINKVAITAPATGSTLTIADGKTLTASNSLTLAGTDASTLNIGTGGTLGSNAYTSTAFAPLASPTLTGTPTAPTAAAGTNTTQIATTAYVDATASSGSGSTKQIAVIFTDVNSSSAGAINLSQHTVNTATNGDKISFEYSGVFANNANSKPQMVLTVDGTDFTIPSITPGTGNSWIISGSIIRDSGITYKIYFDYTQNLSGGFSWPTVSGGATLDTNQLIITLTAPTTVASSDIVLRTASIQKFNAP